MTKRVSNNELEIVHDMPGVAGSRVVTVRETRGYAAWPKSPMRRMSNLAKTALPTPRAGETPRVSILESFTAGGLLYGVYTVWLE